MQAALYQPSEKCVEGKGISKAINPLLLLYPLSPQWRR